VNSITIERIVELMKPGDPEEEEIDYTHCLQAIDSIISQSLK